MASMDGKKAREGGKSELPYICVHYYVAGKYVLAAGKERNERRMGKLIKST